MRGGGVVVGFVDMFIAKNRTRIEREREREVEVEECKRVQIRKIREELRNMG